MIRDVDQPVTDLAGHALHEPISLQDLLAATAEMTSEQREAIAAAINKTGRPALTLKRAMVNALQAMFEDERQLEGEKKLERWKLAMKIHLGGEIDLTAEEIVLVKRLVGKLYGPSVVGPVWTALEEGKPKEALESKAA